MQYLLFSKFLWEVLSALLIGTASLVAASNQDDFLNFVTNAVEEFPNWLLSTGRDPPPVIPYRVNFSNDAAFMNVSGFITDHKIGPISELMFINPVGADLLKGRFDVNLDWRNVNVEAFYDTQGTIMASIPVSGNGSCRFQYEIIETSFSATDLVVTPNGYFNLSAASITCRSYSMLSTSTFDELSAGGYEENVIQIMNRAQNGGIQRYFPVNEYLKIYFTELFEATPISEIIGTTVQPSTTVVASTTSTTSPSTSTVVTTETTTTTPGTTPHDDFTTISPSTSTIAEWTTPDPPITTASDDTTITTSFEASTSTIYPCVSTSLKTILHNETVLDKVFKNGTDGTLFQITKKLLLVSVIEQNTTSAK